MEGFREIAPQEWEANPFQRIGKDWMLIGAKKDGRTNMMTASWGGVGVLWNKPVVFAFVRPQRFTRGLIDGAGRFSCTFFPDGWREQLTLCGKESGRDTDKVAATGLSVLEDGGIPYFAQGNAALLCEALFCQQLDPAGFLEKELDGINYPEKDYHYMYVAEIKKLLVKD